MEYKKVTNESGLTLEITSSYNDGNISTFWGGDSSNPSWDEYLNGYKDEFKNHVTLIKQSIIENELVGEKGSFSDNS